MHIDFFKLNIYNTDSEMHACLSFWKVFLHFAIHSYDLSFQIKLCSSASILTLRSDDFTCKTTQSNVLIDELIYVCWIVMQFYQLLIIDFTQHASKHAHCIITCMILMIKNVMKIIKHFLMNYSSLNFICVHSWNMHFLIHHYSIHITCQDSCSLTAVFNTTSKWCLLFIDFSLSFLYISHHHVICFVLYVISSDDIFLSWIFSFSVLHQNIMSSFIMSMNMH